MSKFNCNECTIVMLKFEIHLSTTANKYFVKIKLNVRPKFPL